MIYKSKLNPTNLINNGSGRFFVGQRSVGHISEALACAVAFGATAASLNWTYNTNETEVTDIALQQLPKAGFINDLESLDWENMTADQQFMETVFSICYFASKQNLPVLATCEHLVVPALLLVMASPQFDYDRFNKALFLRKLPLELPSKQFLEERLGKRSLAQGGTKSGIAKSLFKTATHFLSFPLKNLKQSETNKEFLRTAQTAVFKQHASLRENAEMKSPIIPGLITTYPSPYFTAMAELSAISFQQDLTTVSDNFGAHVQDTGEYACILMFHHASRLHPHLTKKQLLEFVTDNYEGAIGAQGQLPQLQAILMGKLPVSNVSQKGFLSLVDRDTKRVFNENYQQVASWQNIVNKAVIGPIAKFMIYTAGMPIETTNSVRETGQTLVNQLENNTDFDTSRVLANESILAINPFESVESEDLLLLLKDDLECNKYDQSRLHNMLKGRSHDFHNEVVELIKARDNKLSMASIHKNSIRDFIKISNAYLEGTLQPATTIIENEK